MNRWLGVGADYLERYSKRTDNVVFLHIKRTKKPVEEKQEAPAEKVGLIVAIIHYHVLVHIYILRVLLHLLLKGVTTGNQHGGWVPD